MGHHHNQQSSYAAMRAAMGQTDPSQYGGFRGPKVQVPTDRQQDVATFTSRTYGWMAFALAITAVVAWFTASTGLVFELMPYMLPLIVVEFVMVGAISLAIYRMPFALAAGFFLIYATLNGLTLSVIFIAYDLGTIFSAFLASTMTFGFMTVYGYTTKRDLTSVGNIAFMALIGIIIASVVNMFMHSELMYWAVTYIGVLIFVALTAYDAQRIKAMALMGDVNSTMQQKNSIVAALSVYLDFINLFLLLLRIFGGGRD